MELIVEIFLGIVFFGNLLGCPLVMAAGVMVDGEAILSDELRDALKKLELDDD